MNHPLSSLSQESHVSASNYSIMCSAR